MAVEKKSEENKNEGMSIEQQKEMAKLLAEATAKLEEKNSGNSEDSLKQLVQHLIDQNKAQSLAEESFETAQYSKDESLSAEDLLPKDKWVTFIAHKVGYVLVDKKVGKRQFKAPLGPIEFKYEATKRVTAGRETEIFNWCSYTCKSKAEMEWITTHPLYGVMFFGSFNEARSLDAKKAAKLARLMTTLGNLGQSDLISMARQNGLDVVNDPQELRASIASKLADDQMKQEESQNLIRLKEKQFEEKIIGR
jgi:hypothetical protein